MKKSVIFTALALLIFGMAESQMIALSPIQKADKEFEAFGYTEALKYYQIALEETKLKPYVYQRIAECYMKLNQPSRSEMWLKRAIDLQDDPDPKLILGLAEAFSSEQSIQIWVCI